MESSHLTFVTENHNIFCHRLMFFHHIGIVTRIATRYNA